MSGYRTIDHTGDVGIEWEAPDLPALFEEGARAFAGLVTGCGDLAAGGIERCLDLDAFDLPDLLVRFLSELLYRFETAGELLAGCEVETIDPGGGDRRARLRCRLRGRSFDASREEVELVIKAVTHHALEVEPAPRGGWRARVLFDV